MVPTPNSPFTYDYWETTRSNVVELICLLPNSVYIPMEINWNATIQDIKVDLWEKAVCYPLFGLLGQMSTYVFQFVNSLAVTEEIEDETTRIRDIKPICGVFIIVEKSYERPGEQLLNTHISHLIGKRLTEFDNVRSSEVNDFRMRMRYLAEESLIRRAQSTSLERLRYQYPPRLADSSEIPTTLKNHLKKHCFILSTKCENTEFSFQSVVPATRTPQQYIDIILRQFVETLNMQVENPLNYVLKVCGREEYIFGDYPLIQFLYIQEMLSMDGVPEVLPIEISQLMLTQKTMRPYPYCLPERRRMIMDHSNSMRKKKNESSWNINKDYSCIVHNVNNLNVDATQLSVEVVCQAGIFHGGKALCETQETRAVVVSRDGVAQWDQELTFPIKVYNLPRMSRVCFGVYEITKSRGKRRGKDANKEGTRLAWANTMIFDYKDQLRTDCVTLSMWTHVADDTQGDALVLHPLDTVVPNPNTESSATLQVFFSNYDCKVPVLYPEDKTIDEYSKHADNVSPNVMAKKTNIEQLRATAAKDPLYEIYEQDKKAIWASRERFRTEAPEVLPKLLSCVEWDDRTEVATVRHILAEWPMLRVEFALELLDYAYADCAVRSFAVKCLSKISDNDLLLYLLQLVQALKHESYLMCDLSTFLLKRAFKNITIGRYLFWYLRSEMQVPSVSMRFGLLLEAYCRGSQEHIHSFMKQISCIDKLKWVREHVKKKKDIRQARALLVEHLQEKHCEETLRDFVSPLNPTFVCKSIKPKSCRVMDSKMRPLMLEFENRDSMGSNIRIILKIGDDLRQDMFTLQMLRIMDKLWKSHGYDFRLNPYNCISLGYMMGMIEVVEESETVANIQKQSAMFNAASAFKKSALYQWLIKVTENKKKLSKTVDEFTMSCAGYSVATYVLGIADRHPDNIMLKKNGQLFHIDFGHFLGHFKHKYGFKRERVPFVLPYDFIHVINKGQKGTGDKVPMEFKIFRDHCETAFKILRKHGHLILSLFSMMISTGLPELSSEKDLQYLRDTLVMDLSEEKAMEHFRQKFNEALKNSWTTSINWWIHNVAGGQIVPAQS